MTNRHFSAKDCQLYSRFEALRKVLVEERFAIARSRPIAHWVLPDDRRMPLALLDLTLGKLLETPFAELRATQGVGQTKIHSLLRLLQRISESESVKELDEIQHLESQPPAAFEPRSVSESLWAQWRGTIQRHGLRQEMIGRLAPELQRLPTVIWRRRLSDYLDLTLVELAELPTHGEKRVQAVLEVFYFLHRALSVFDPQLPLTVRLKPRFIAVAEDWLQFILDSPKALAPGDLKQQAILPLLNQIQIDGGETVHQLAVERLAMEGTLPTVKQQANQLGVTRARVYQLLDQASRIIAIRWPEGASRWAGLAEPLNRNGDFAPDCQLWELGRRLFFAPASNEKRRMGEKRERKPAKVAR